MKIEYKICFNCSKISNWICDVCKQFVCFDCVNLRNGKDICDKCMPISVESALDILELTNTAISEALCAAARRFQTVISQRKITISRKNNDHIVNAIHGLPSGEFNEPRDDEIYNP